MLHFGLFLNTSLLKKNFTGYVLVNFGNSGQLFIITSGHSGGRFVNVFAVPLNINVYQKSIF